MTLLAAEENTQFTTTVMNAEHKGRLVFATYSAVGQTGIQGALQMKLSEFLEEVKGLPPDTELVFNMTVGCCSETEELTLEDIETSYKGLIVLRFDQLDFLDSCRKYGAALRNGRKGWK